MQTYFYIEKGKCLDVKIILEKQNKTFVEYQKYEYPIIEGYVVDNETGKPLSDVKVTIEDENNVVYTDEKGFLLLCLKNFLLFQILMMRWCEIISLSVKTIIKQKK